ncbi:6977_t:CDS:1, partial [Acaulospora morrowiae]
RHHALNTLDNKWHYALNTSFEPKDTAPKTIASDNNPRSQKTHPV